MHLGTITFFAEGGAEEQEVLELLGLAGCRV